MFNFDKIENTAILTDPYTHMVCEEFADINILTQSHEVLKLCDEWNTEDTHDMELYRLDKIDPLLDSVVNEINTYDWRPLLSKMGVEYSNHAFSWQATKLIKPLGPHTDESEITGVVAKVLVYVTPEVNCGTIIHNADRSVNKITPGKIGDAFVFKTATNSFHSTNYDHLDPTTRRVSLVGCFHA